MGESPEKTDLERLLAEERWVRAVAHQLLRDPADAEDVAQQTWAAAIEHPPATDRPVRPWLRAVVRNFAAMSRRAAGRRQLRERHAVRPEAPPRPDELVEQATLHRELVDLVLALPEIYRTVILLRFFRDQTSVEIARNLQIPEGTVRVRLMRALALLRQRLEDERRHDGRDLRASLVLVAGIAPRRALASGAGVAAGAAIIVAVFTLGWLAWSETPFTKARGSAAPGEVPAAESATVADARPDVLAPPGTPEWTAPLKPVPFTAAELGCTPYRPPGGLAELRLLVVDGAWQPVAGAAVSLGGSFSGQTLSDGRLSVSRAALGGGAPWRLRVDHPDFVPAEAELELRGDEQAVELARAGGVEVTVVEAIAPVGPPIAGAVVRRVISWMAESSGVIAPAATTDENGIARLTRVPAGQLELVVTAPGREPTFAMVDVPEGAVGHPQVQLKPAVTRTVDVLATDDGDRPWIGRVALVRGVRIVNSMLTRPDGSASFVVTEDQAEQSVRALGPRGELAQATVPMIAEPATLQLRVPTLESVGIQVLDERQQPVDAAVAFEPAPSRDAGPAGQRWGSVRTEPDGIARFSLPRGEYLLRVLVAGTECWHDQVTVNGTTKFPVTVATGGTRIIVVRDDAGEPLRGWRALLVDETGAGGGMMTTDHAGRLLIGHGIGRGAKLELASPAWEGMITLPLEPSGAERESVVVVPHWTATFEVRELVAGAARTVPVLISRVDDGVDPNFQPARNPTVHAPTDGRLRIALPAGRWRASVMGTDGPRSLPVEFELPRDAATLVRLVACEFRQVDVDPGDYEGPWSFRWRAGGELALVEGEISGNSVNQGAMPG